MGDFNKHLAMAYYCLHFNFRASLQLTLCTAFIIESLFMKLEWVGRELHSLIGDMSSMSNCVSGLLNFLKDHVLNICWSTGKKIMHKLDTFYMHSQKNWGDVSVLFFLCFHIFGISFETL